MSIFSNFLRFLIFTSIPVTLCSLSRFIQYGHHLNLNKNIEISSQGTMMTGGPIFNSSLPVLQFISTEREFSNQPDSIPTVQNVFTGRVWMDRNLGASKVATHKTDREALGYLYQWGRYTDGHQERESEVVATLATTFQPSMILPWDGKFILESTSSETEDWLNNRENLLWQGQFGLNNVCPSGFRVPTEEEWEEERLTWTSNDREGAFSSPLKLTMGGERYLVDGEVGSIGFIGAYWSSTPDGAKAKALAIYSTNAYLISNSRAYGFSVRCIRD